MYIVLNEYHCPVPDSIPANHSVILGAIDLLRQYAAGPGHHAGSGRSAKDCPAVWTGFQREGQHDERGTRHQYGGQYDTVGSQGNHVTEVQNDNLFISTKPESDGKPLAVEPAGFRYPVRGGTSFSAGPGAAPLYGTCGGDTLFRFSHHPHG